MRSRDSSENKTAHWEGSDLFGPAVNGAFVISPVGDITLASSFEELSFTTYLGNLSKPTRIQYLQVRYDKSYYHNVRYTLLLEVECLLVF